MKKLLGIIILFTLILGINGLALAETSDEVNVTISVPEPRDVDALEPDTLDLQYSDGPSFDSDSYTVGEAEDEDYGIRVIHNLEEEDQLDVEVYAEEISADYDNDIDLKVNVERGTNVNVVNNGDPIAEAEAETIWADVPNGEEQLSEVTYTADASLSTPSGNYEYNVIYTLVEIE